MSFALSFAPEFFWGDGSATPENLAHSDRPTSVYQALLSLPDETWATIARDVFHCPPDNLDVPTVLAKVQETDACRNLDSPVEVQIDPAGCYTVLVYDNSKEAP
jgi:hypothetical protein